MSWSTSLTLGLVAIRSRMQNWRSSRWQGTLVLVCHPQHPFARQKTVKLKALAGQK